MKNKQIVFLLLLVSFAPAIFAQKKVILEKVRCFSTAGPIMTYWRSDEIRKTFVADLGSALMRHQSLVLPDTSKVQVELLSTAEGAGSVRPSFSDTSSENLHLYFDLYELDINSFFYYLRSMNPDTNMQKKAVSGFMMRATIFNSLKKTEFTEDLYISVTHGESAGIGLQYNSFNAYGKIPASIKGFSGLLNRGMDILLNPKNDLQLIEIRVPPAYLGDNYILGRSVGMPRVMVTTQQGVSRYTYDGKVEILRLGDTFYEEIVYAGKKAQAYPAPVVNAIKRSKNFENSDFVFLRQDGRDVVRDKNYLVKLMVQIDPDFRSSGAKGMFTNFIQEPLHYLISEKDTVATFLIRKNVLNEEGKKIYLNQVSNGADLNSLFRLDIGSEWNVRYNYVTTGIIAGKNFRIVHTGSDNSLKEIYIEGKIACIAEGATALNKFIVFDNSLTAQLLNQLFIISFNGFTE